jgi:hypothetical protein
MLQPKSDTEGESAKVVIEPTLYKGSRDVEVNKHGSDKIQEDLG